MYAHSLRVVLLGSAAMLCFSTANAQTQDGSQPPVNAGACIVLADQLSQDTTVDADVRSQIEEVISTGDIARCDVILATWEREGTITREALELVTTEQVTERLIVQQEVEVAAEAAVYQPPAEVDVDTGTPEIMWTMPRQNITIEEQAPQITVRQGQPTIAVEVPQPRVTVMIPEPEVIVTWPDSSANVAALEPTIEVRIPEPIVTVNMPDPIVELTIGGSLPQDLVQLEDGRFAPQGTTTADLEPRISLLGQEATITPGPTVEEPEVVFNRGEPMVTFEGADPQVTVDVVGEPDIQILRQEPNVPSNPNSPAVEQTEGSTAAPTDN